MNYTLVKNADAGITARATINNNFATLFNTGLIACELATQITPAITTTYTKVNLIDTIIAVSSDIFEYDTTNKKIKVLKTGLYYFSGNTIFESSNSNEILQFTLYKNEIATNIKAYTTSAGSGKKNTVQFQGYISLTANDLLNFYAKCETGSTTMTVYTTSIGIEKKVY